MSSQPIEGLFCLVKYSSHGVQMLIETPLNILIFHLVLPVACAIIASEHLMKLGSKTTESAGA
jgi:hypothetical protein